MALDFDDRYGRKRSPIRFLAYALLASLLAWLFWTGAFHSNPVVVPNLISFNAVNEKSMSIKFEITRRDPKQVITCKLNAVDIDKFVVGEIEYRIAAGAKHQIISTKIPTRARPVSASVVRCYAAN